MSLNWATCPSNGSCPLCGRIPKVGDTYIGHLDHSTVRQYIFPSTYSKHKADHPCFDNPAKNQTPSLNLNSYSKAIPP